MVELGRYKDAYQCFESLIQTNNECRTYFLSYLWCSLKLNHKIDDLDFQIDDNISNDFCFKLGQQNRFLLIISNISYFIRDFLPELYKKIFIYIN